MAIFAAFVCAAATTAAAERIKAAFNAAFYKGDGPASVASTARLNLSARSRTGLRWSKRIIGTGNWFSDMYL